VLYLFNLNVKLLVTYYCKKLDYLLYLAYLLQTGIKSYL